MERGNGQFDKVFKTKDLTKKVFCYQDLTEKDLGDCWREIFRYINKRNKHLDYCEKTQILADTVFYFYENPHKWPEEYRSKKGFIQVCCTQSKNISSKLYKTKRKELKYLKKLFKKNKIDRKTGSNNENMNPVETKQVNPKVQEKVYKAIKKDKILLDICRYYQETSVDKPSRKRMAKDLNLEVQEIYNAFKRFKRILIPIAKIHGRNEIIRALVGVKTL